MSIVSVTFDQPAVPSAYDAACDAIFHRDAGLITDAEYRQTESFYLATERERERAAIARMAA